MRWNGGIALRFAKSYSLGIGNMMLLNKVLGLSVFLLTLAFVVTFPSYAAQWVYLGDSQDGKTFYLDFDSLKGEGNERTFWGRVVSRNGMTISLDKWIINCHYRQYGILETINYYPDGSFRSHYKTETSIGGMLEFIPGTIAEAHYEYICSRITTQPQGVTSSTTIAANQYPKSVCGDPKPSTPGQHQLYPVFVNYSPSRLNQIKTQLCLDAFQIRRQSGKVSIQVASFTSINNAMKFSRFLERLFGDSEIGEPTTIYIP